jgi:hypothetical protein
MYHIRSMCVRAYVGRQADWVEALDGLRLEDRLDPHALDAADAGPAGTHTRTTLFQSWRVL